MILVCDRIRSKYGILKYKYLPHYPRHDNNHYWIFLLKIQLAPYGHVRFGRYLTIQGRQDTQWRRWRKTYINYIIVLSKDFFRNHIEQLIIIFGILRAAGLKFNVLKCSLGLKEIPYLCYVITRGVIKPDRNKV